MSIENHPIPEEVFTFDESRFKIRSSTVLSVSEVPTIIRFFIKRKIVKNESQATAVLLTLVLLLVVISVFFIHKSVGVAPAILNPELTSE